MVPNQPTDKNAKFPNRGVALIHHPFGIVASGVSHHPSPPQPASESAACELPGEISHLDVQQGGSLGSPLQIDMAKRMGRKLTENSSFGKIGMEWKKNDCWENSLSNKSKSESYQFNLGCPNCNW